MIGDFEEKLSRLNLKEKIISYHTGSKSPALDFYHEFVQNLEEQKKLKKSKALKSFLQKKAKTMKLKQLKDESSDFDYALQLPPISQRFDQINKSFDFGQLRKQKNNRNQISVDQIMDIIGPEMETKPSTYLQKISDQKVFSIPSLLSPSSTNIQTEINQNISQLTESQGYCKTPQLKRQVYSRYSILKKKCIRIIRGFFNPIIIGIIDTNRGRYESEEMIKEEIEKEEMKISFKQIEEIQRQKKIKRAEGKPFRLENRREKTQRSLIEKIENVIDVSSIIINGSIEKAMPLLKYIEAIQKQLFQLLIEKNLNGIQKFIYEMLEICQDIKDLNSFTQLVYFLAEISLDCSQTNQATFFANDCLIICEYSKNYEIKCKILQLLSKCARKFKQYQQSIALIKKALNYAWVGNFDDLEIECYDLMGLTYFYMGDIQKAIIFHEKWTLADTEPQKGYFRETARAFATFYERFLGYFTLQFSNTLMMKLALPILNKQDPIEINTEDGTIHYQKCGFHRLKHFDNSDGSQIIDQIVNSAEFVKFNLDYYQIKKKIKNIKQIIEKKTRINVRIPQPKRIVEIKAKYQRKQRNVLEHDIYDNPDLVPNLEMKVKYRLNQSIDDPQFAERVERSIGLTRQPYGQKQEQIYVRHIHSKFLKPESIEMFYHRHHSFFKTLVMKLLNHL